MVVDLNWTPERVDKFLRDLILDIYYEFVYNARDQRRWDAGMETIGRIQT